MTHAKAQTIANTIVGLAGVVAGFVMLRNHESRRAAFRLLRNGVTMLPGFLIQEAKEAWREAERRPRRETMMP